MIYVNNICMSYMLSALDKGWPPCYSQRAMATARYSFTCPIPAEQIWGVASDFNRWNDIFILDDPRSKGWGDRFIVSGFGAGARVDMFYNNRIMQTWGVDEWSPPRRMRLSSRRFYALFFMAMKSHFSLNITTQGTGSAVDLELASEFSFPLLGWLLNIYVPLKAELNTVLLRMEAAILLSCGAVPIEPPEA